MKLSHLLKKLKEEVISVIPAVIYFCIAFNLIHLAVGLMLKPDDVRYLSYTTVTIGALIIGKVLIIADSLPFINLFPTKPLIYNIIWKFFLYNICVVIVWSLDTFVQEYYFFFKSAYAAWGQVLFDYSTPFFWSAQLALWMTFLVFTVFSELTRAIGKEKMKKMIFG